MRDPSRKEGTICSAEMISRARLLLAPGLTLYISSALIGRVVLATWTLLSRHETCLPAWRYFCYCTRCTLVLTTVGCRHVRVPGFVDHPLSQYDSGNDGDSIENFSCQHFIAIEGSTLKCFIFTYPFREQSPCVFLIEDYSCICC